MKPTKWSGLLAVVALTGACASSEQPLEQPFSPSPGCSSTFSCLRRSIRSLSSGTSTLLLPCNRALTPRLGVGRPAVGRSSAW